MFRTKKPKKLAFYIDYDKYGREEAPATLQFAQLLRDIGHEVDLATSEDELLEGVRQRKYDVVALSILSSAELRGLLATAVKVKKADPCTVSVVGGQGVQGYLETLPKAMGVDVVVEGEGELVFPAILEHLERAPAARKGELVEPFGSAEVAISEEDRKFLGGVDAVVEGGAFYKSPITEEQAKAIKEASFERTVKRDGKEIRISVPLRKVAFNTAKNTYILDEKHALDQARRKWEREGSAFPLDFKFLHTHPSQEELNELATTFPWEEIGRKGWEGISLYAQRGCNWGRCSYCGIKTPAGRRLSVAKVVALLEEAAEKGIRAVTFDDDQFVQSTRWVEELCDSIVKKGLNKRLVFGAMIRVDAIKDRTLLKKLGEANFGRLQIGVESFVPEKVRYFSKTPEGKEEEYIKKAEDLIYACLEEGIVPGVFIITTRPKRKGALLEIAGELLRISEIIKKASRYELMPIFSFSDMLMAYPGAPLLEKEGYKKILAPLRPYREGNEIKIERVEIPYTFEFKSMALANFIGIHRKISERRGIPGEVLNETWEHIDDLTQALEISASHLDSDVGVALAFVEQLDRFPRESVATLIKQIEGVDPEKELRPQLASLLVRRILSPENLKEAVRRTGDEEALDWIEKGLPRELAKEKGEVLEKCRKIMENLRGVTAPVHKRVQRYMEETKRELKEIEAIEDRIEFSKRVEEVRRKTERFQDSIYPYLAGRMNLENLLKWMEEFERARA